MLLIISKTGKPLSPEDAAICVNGYDEWMTEMGERHVTARRLDLESGVLINKNKEMVTDGPFAESKELVAGMVIVTASNMEEATDIAHSCPLIDYFDLMVKSVHVNQATGVS